MTRLTIKLTVQELKLLSGLASDQLFRREFIDHRLPGAPRDPEELGLGKQLVARLQALLAAPPPRSSRRVARRAPPPAKGRRR